MMIEIPFDIYQKLLDNRRDFIKEHYGWQIPEAIWNYALEVIEECGIEPEHTDPSYVVDNLAVNSDYADIKDYRQDDETMEQTIERLERSGDCMAVVYDNDDKTYYVIRSL